MKWLEDKNHAAAKSLEEADKETLTIIKLRAPSLLKKTLLSTNPIESAFSKVRAKSGRIKNWKSGSDQISRWSATLLLEVEKKFHKLEGYKQIPMIVEEMRKNTFTQELKYA